MQMFLARGTIEKYDYDWEVNAAKYILKTVLNNQRLGEGSLLNRCNSMQRN